MASRGFARIAAESTRAPRVLRGGSRRAGRPSASDVTAMTSIRLRKCTPITRPSMIILDPQNHDRITAITFLDAKDQPVLFVQPHGPLARQVAAQLFEMQ